MNEDDKCNRNLFWEDVHLDKYVILSTDVPKCKYSF